MPQELYREEKEKIEQIFKALENEQVKDFCVIRVIWQLRFFFYEWKYGR